VEDESALRGKRPPPEAGRGTDVYGDARLKDQDDGPALAMQMETRKKPGVLPRSWSQ